MMNDENPEDEQEFEALLEGIDRETKTITFSLNCLDDEKYIPDFKQEDLFAIVRIPQFKLLKG